MTSTQRLIHYAKAMGLKVVFRLPKRVIDNNPGVAACFNKDTVYIGPEISNKHLPYVLAHELGHYLDFKSRTTRQLAADKKAYKLVEKEVFHGQKVNRTLLLRARRMEQRANGYGWGLIQHLGLDLKPGVYREVCEANLKAYR